MQKTAGRSGGQKTGADSVPHELVAHEKKRLGLSGRELGSFIDKEHSLMASATYASEQRKKSIEIKAERDDVSLYTQLLLDYKRTCGWTSLSRQFVVADVDMRIATMIDEICHDEDFNMIVIEHKYGYEDYRDEGNAFMDEPLEDIVNSPLNQHFLQVGWALLVLEKFWNVKVHAAFVLYITDVKCEAKVLPDWFYERRVPIWERYRVKMERRLN